MLFRLLELLTLVAPAIASYRSVPENGDEAIASLRNRNPFSNKERLDSSIKFSKRQDAVPPGVSLAYVPRTKIGAVPYGVEINSCYQKGVIGLTFDDGPSAYTNDLLDLLATYNAKATFFINGNNNGVDQIYDCSTGYPDIIRRMYREGHQIASHTWSHKDLSTLDEAAFKQEVYYNEQAINAILGIFPTYMRPPYLSCDATCLSRLATLGYHTIQCDLDTQDWQYDDPDLIQNSKDIFDDALEGKVVAATSYLPLEHDIHYQTVYSLVEYMLQRMQTYGYASVAVGTCLNDPVGNWYRPGTGGTVVCDGVTTTPTTTAGTTAPTTTAGTTTPTTALTTSPDGQCGTLYTCNGLDTAYRCCSQWGWCGSSTEHCGTGCQAGFGQCS